MAYTVQIELAGNCNESLQLRDTIYYSNVQNAQGGRNHPTPGHNSKPEALGEVSGINRTITPSQISVDCYSNNQTAVNNIIDAGPYFFFSKNKQVNMSGILGYYALVEYRNYSKKQAEIFATGVEHSISSK